MLSTGLDLLASEPARLAEFLGSRPVHGGRSGGKKQGPRAALLANPSSVTRRLARSVEIVRDSLEAIGGELGLLLGPEHGFYGEGQAGEAIADGKDRRTGLPVLSLYGAAKRPRAELLEELDLLLVDIQDLGIRCYTYLSTLDLLVGAIADLERRGRSSPLLLVLDRPNPLGGRAISGMGVEEGCTSFVGALDIPLRHGLSLGELALLSAAGRTESVAVLRMEGWRRRMLWPETGLPWVLPSPNMPSFESALAYGATVLFEGTNLSEGRGTTKPFEILGAPWVDAEELAGAISALGLPGLLPRPMRFVPSFSKFATEPCEGVQLHITDPLGFEPAASGYALLELLRSLYPARFEILRPRAGEAEPAPRPFLDLITGNGLASSGARAAELSARADRDSGAFRISRRPYLLYPEEEE